MTRERVRSFQAATRASTPTPNASVNSTPASLRNPLFRRGHRFGGGSEQRAPPSPITRQVELVERIPRKGVVQTSQVCHPLCSFRDYKGTLTS